MINLEPVFQADARSKARVAGPLWRSEITGTVGVEPCANPYSLRCPLKNDGIRAPGSPRHEGHRRSEWRHMKIKRNSAAATHVAARVTVPKSPQDHEPVNADSGDAEAKNSLALSVGKEIRKLRLGVNIAANELAARAGLSKGMLSKIERGTAAPSFTTLAALSAGLKVPVARLFAGHIKREDFSLVRAGKGIEVQRRGPTVGLNYELLGHLLSGESQIEPYLVTISDSATPGRGFQHPGIEFMYVLQGAMQYRYADTIVELYPGDTLVFDSNAIHGHERLLQSPVKFLSVVITNRS